MDRRANRAYRRAVRSCSGPIHQLALNGALRFYHDPEAPYGIVGDTRELPMYMRSLMTDSDALLLGYRTDFGIG